MIELDTSTPRHPPASLRSRRRCTEVLRHLYAIIEAKERYVVEAIKVSGYTHYIVHEAELAWSVADAAGLLEHFPHLCLISAWHSVELFVYAQKAGLDWHPEELHDVVRYAAEGYRWRY